MQKKTHMNYFLRVDGVACFSLRLSEKNKTDLSSDLALGTFISNDAVPDLIHYVYTPSSGASFSDVENSDFILNVSGGFLVNAKVREIVEEYFYNECQFIKAEVEYKGKCLEHFYAINIFNRVHCYDLDLSEYENIDGSYDFEKIILKETPLEEYGAEYNIVRSEEDNKVVVSEDFKKKMESNCIQNLFFESEFDMFS